MLKVHLSHCLSLVSRFQYALSSSLQNCQVQFKSQTFAKGNPLNLEADEMRQSFGNGQHVVID